MTKTPGTVSRRDLLRSGGAAVAALAATSLIPDLGAARADNTLPTGLSAEELWERNHRLADLGPRLTGNVAHQRFIESIAEELDEIGLKVHRDPLSFDRWDPLDWRLTIGGRSIPVAFYFPYSGVTGREGVTSQLQYLGVFGRQPAWELARGKIAVVEVPAVPLPITVGYRVSGSYPANAAPPDTLAVLPSISDVAVAPDLKGAAAAGVRGVICIRTGVSEELAADQYAPFTTGYQGCPAIWVGPSQAARVRTLAQRGERATLVMHAKRTRKATTETIYSILPGTHPTETVVINTHTDGPNVAEENGAYGLLSLARQFAKIPAHKRRRTLIFVFVTGHFQLPQFEAEVGAEVGPMQASSRWMVMHRDLWDGRGRHKNAVAALTVEHLGCTEWSDDAQHRRYAPTGRNDVAWCYCTTPTMRSLYLAGARNTANTRTFTCDPLPGTLLRRRWAVLQERHRNDVAHPVA